MAWRIEGSDDPSWAAKKDFEGFVHSLDTRDDEGDQIDESYYLGYFLRRWIEEGDGVAMTGGKYEHYLRVALDIADQAMQGRLDLSYADTSSEPPVDIPRRIIAITPVISNDENSYAIHYADPMLYDMTASHRQREVSQATPPQQS